ncbi:hypothetical protein E2C01_094968 [Portunus trituberculatus]|uniref:Uncharacterized protein n=1 Tax=Portunus trituberculatus TaxID=210409 RepID=A0A5B7K2B8_PORTR|nr:hypothetical protein [Portunus trituberculatus]
MTCCNRSLKESLYSHNKAQVDESPCEETHDQQRRERRDPWTGGAGRGGAGRCQVKSEKCANHFAQWQRSLGTADLPVPSRNDGGAAQKHQARAWRRSPVLPQVWVASQHT